MCYYDKASSNKWLTDSSRASGAHPMPSAAPADATDPHAPYSDISPTAGEGEPAVHDVHPAIEAALREHFGEFGVIVVHDLDGDTYFFKSNDIDLVVDDSEDEADDDGNMLADDRESQPSIMGRRRRRCRLTKRNGRRVLRCKR